MTMKQDTSFGKKMNSTPLKRFFPFFKKVMATYPAGNCSGFGQCRIHHAKLLRPFLEAQRIGELVCRTPCSPQLNIVEGLWKWLKSSVIQ
ncbi:hypothetical protein P7H22_16770 [Paenibacillus larvae]|nr:transposase [Paenibacillus larvae]MDT2241673.1 hypothetical protein [Paenibacillus larvae]